MLCPFCFNTATPDYENFSATVKGIHIFVPNIAIYRCTMPSCEMEWLPRSEELKIDIEMERKGLESNRQKNAKQTQGLLDNRGKTPYKAN